MQPRRASAKARTTKTHTQPTDVEENRSAQTRQKNGRKAKVTLQKRGEGRTTTKDKLLQRHGKTGRVWSRDVIYEMFEWLSSNCYEMNAVLYKDDNRLSLVLEGNCVPVSRERLELVRSVICRCACIVFARKGHAGVLSIRHTSVVAEVCNSGDEVARGDRSVSRVMRAACHAKVACCEMDTWVLCGECWCLGLLVKVVLKNDVVKSRVYFCKSKLLDDCFGGFGSVGVTAEVIEIAVWMWLGEVMVGLKGYGGGGMEGVSDGGRGMEAVVSGGGGGMEAVGSGGGGGMVCSS
ncbi:hypothetical protein Tco_0436199 [Tanacetum coccineum]